tara:strand:+ start:159 stop:542 length:384 start_codon:yes stop_codon:yes gene_type:complete
MRKEQFPISPHLQIYKPQITSILSITHRVTGFCLNLILILILLWLTSLSFGENMYNYYMKLMGFFPLRVIIFFTILGFSYHMLNGIRHIFWDFGLFIENKSATIFGYSVVIISISLSVYLTILLDVF